MRWMSEGSGCCFAWEKANDQLKASYREVPVAHQGEITDG
jgi:hypothetical protein